MPPTGKSLFLIILLILCLTDLSAQTNGINRSDFRIGISKTNESITVDGQLKEQIWMIADKADNFRRVMPTDTGFAAAKTEVQMAYNDATLFLAITCFDPTAGKRPVESLRRDFAFMKNDNFIVFIDTYNDFTNGFAFGVSPAGAQWDGVQANGGVVNLDWDIKWRSEVKNYDDKWVAEFAIPFRSMRYKEGAAEWGINFSRHDLKLNEKSSWAPMPRQFATASLAFAGTLVWDKPLPASGLRFSVIPYISHKTTQDRQAGESFSPDYRDIKAGVDAKLTLSTSMNLDLTVNPDYSQVEVDRQVTNLDRFELFFPEKRQFYLENSDLFANLGTENIRPFFSRRIGLDAPVLAGARLSGKIGNNWRLGLMDIQTDAHEETAANNFAVAAIQRRVSSHSNITAFMVNKTNIESGVDPYNNVAGLEYNLATADNRWTGKMFWHQVLSNNDGFFTGSAFAANILYATQYFRATLNQAYIGPSYNPEVGYLRRSSYYQVNPTAQYKFYPEESRIANHGPGIKFDMFLDWYDATITDRETQVFYQVEWLNRSILMADVKDVYLLLRYPFDPTNTGGVMYEAGDDFDWKEAGLTYTSDIRKLFNFLIGTRYGGFFDGAKWTVNGELNYRVQPYGSLALVAAYNDIHQPHPHNDAKLWLVGPRLDITFTDRVFFTSFVQYNSQIDNINLNLRFQWRFAPVSDLFIVYTENAFPNGIESNTGYQVKNRGLVFKLSYWFN